jgi:Zn-finger nucleic acid-binding protein
MSLTTCSRCGKEFNSGMRDCPFCGHPRPVEVTREQPTCPRCTLPLESKPFRGQPVDVCPRCEGVWLDSGEFEILTSERDVFADDTLPRHFVRTPPQGETAYLECVRCGRIMNRQNYRTISGVVIDVCPDHGVWLDREELTELRTFVATGVWKRRSSEKPSGTGWRFKAWRPGWTTSNFFKKFFTTAISSTGFSENNSSQD